MYKMKQYMVIERFKINCFNQVYERLNTQGRMLPEGLYYINSWINTEQDLCFQLMETNNVTLFDAWVEQWNDLVDFEIIPIDA